MKADGFAKTADRNVVVRASHDMPSALERPRWQQGHNDYNPMFTDRMGYHWDSSGRPIPHIGAAEPSPKGVVRDRRTAESQREALIRGGNSNPDEMLGSRMNPIVIAPGMAYAGASSIPSTAFQAIRESTGSVIKDWLRDQVGQAIAESAVGRWSDWLK